MHKLATTDLRERLRYLYAAKPKPVIVDVPKLRFITFEGRGEPGASAFGEAVQALYAMAFTAKFRLKKEGKGDFKVMPLEGLWFSEGAPRLTWDELQARRAEWEWKLMIAVPEEFDRALFRSVQKELIAKEKANVEKVGFETMKEGPSVQILHIGPYADEPRSLEVMHAFAAANGYELHGRHHEIYLGDPRRTRPERLKTILRHPVKKA